MRRGTAKQEKADCNGATSCVKPENSEVGGRRLVQRSCGNNFRIPANTKNIPVSNKTEIKCASMSPVATGKLSRLSSCINGENTAISTISVSTIFGSLRDIQVIRRPGLMGKAPVTALSVTVATIALRYQANKLNVSGLKLAFAGNAQIAAKYLI